MRIEKAVITAAAPYQRTLPLQNLIDRDGVEKSVLRIVVGHVRTAGVEDIAVVVHPGDERAYSDAAGDDARRLTFITQENPRGYGHAVSCAREFVGQRPFLHVVGDHIYIWPDGGPGARGIIDVA